MPWSFEQDVERYAALGAGAIEIWEKKLSSEPLRRRRQLGLPRKHGLKVSSFQANVHSLFPTHLQREPAEFSRRLETFTEVLESCAPELGEAAFVLNTGVAADGDVERAFEKTVDGYKVLAGRARELGVRLALEPLHPIAMNEDSFIWTLEDALELVESVGEPALGICADIWNLAGQANLRPRLARCGRRVFLAQVSDYRRPRSFLDRLPIGKGSLDFAPFISGVRDAGYDGPWVLEIFSENVPDSLYDGDLGAVITESRDALDHLLASPLADTEHPA
jgi:sugar phosphate isomerase/epimerase